MAALDDLASKLFGSKRAESNIVSTDATTRTYVGTATSASEDGSVYVALSQDVTLPDDDDGEHGLGVEMPTTVAVDEGDEVLVTLMGGGTMKSPVVTGNPGWGDSIQTQVDNAETLAQQAETVAQEASAEVEQVRQDVADFRDDVATTYATKVEREDGDDAVKTWVTTNYTNSNDLSTTYATKTLVSQTKDAIELAASQTYETQSDAAATYATKSALTVGLDGIRSEVAEDYQPKGDYATTASMNSAIQQSASSIESSVAATYETKSDAAATYATKTEVQQTASGLDTRITTAQSTADRAYLERSGTGTTIDTTGAATIRSLVVEGQSVQDGTPTPSAPVPIVSVESRNLATTEVYRKGYLINADGTETASANQQISAAVPVTGGETYHVSYSCAATFNDACRIGWYTNQMVFISRKNVSKAGGNITAPSNAAYLRYCRGWNAANPSNYIYDLQIERGTTAHDYQPYGCINIVGEVGKNLFNPLVYLAYANGDGSYTATANQLHTVRSYMTEQMVGKELTFSAYIFNSTANNLRVSVWVNGTAINGNYNGTDNVLSKVTFTPVSTSDYVYFDFSSFGSASIRDVQLELGSTATEYEPYQCTTTPIDLQGHELRSLPDGTRDEWGVDSLGRVTMTQRVGAVDMGTLTWGYNANGYFYAAVAGKAYGNYNIMCTDYAVTSSDSAAGMSNGEIKGHLTSANVFAKNSAYSDAASFKAAVNGILLWYELATPQEIDLGKIDLPAPADTLWLDAAIVPTIDATWWTVGGIAGQQALDAEVTERQTLIRQFSGGVLAGYVGNAIAALVNAAGSFDVVRTAWTDGVPSILGTLATFGANLIRIGEETGQNVLITSAGQFFRDGLNNLLSLVAGTAHSETFTVESYAYDPTYSYMATHTIGVEHITIQSVTFDGSEFPKFSATTRRGWVYKKSTNLLSLRFHQSDSALGKQVTVNYRTFASMAIYDGTGNDAENIAASFSADDIMLGGSIDGDVDDDKASIRFFGGSVDTETTYIDASGGISTSSVTGDPCYLNREIVLGNIVTDSRLYDDSGRRANGFVSFAQSISDSYNTGGETTSSYVNSYVSMYSGTNNVANYAAITATSVDNLLDSTTSDTETYTEVSARADRIRLEDTSGEAIIPMQQVIVGLTQPGGTWTGANDTATDGSNAWRRCSFTTRIAGAGAWSDYFTLSGGTITALKDVVLEISGNMYWNSGAVAQYGFGLFTGGTFNSTGYLSNGTGEVSNFSYKGVSGGQFSVPFPPRFFHMTAGSHLYVCRYTHSGAVYRDGNNMSYITIKVIEDRSS